MAMTTYLADKIADHTLLSIPYTSPDPVYLALFLTDPTVAGIQTGEVTDPAYVRLSLDTLLSNNGSGVITNDEYLLFNFDALSPSPVRWFGITDTISVGNILYFGEISNYGTPEASTVYKINALQLVLTVG